MDQFTAHLDRGWDLARRGDALGAEASAKRAAALDADSPEAHNLMGYSCALRGDHEGALEMYRQAIALDDQFLEPVLYAAELCIQVFNDPEAALDYCREALALVEGDNELMDVLLLQFDALLLLGNEDEAEAICARLPEPPYKDPEHSFLVGRVLFESGKLVQAEKLLITASLMDNANPDIPYYLGLILDERGDSRGATDRFLESRLLDSTQGNPPPWSLSTQDFALALTKAIDTLVPRLRALVNLDEVYVSDVPGIEVVVEGADPRSPVLLDAMEGSSILLRVFVYHRNIERLSPNEESLIEVLCSCLERELASFAFGESEAPSIEEGTLN